MSRDHAIIRLLAVLAAAVLVRGCGDVPTTPAAPEPARATTVAVSPATAELTRLGATVQLMAEVRDQHARVMSGATVEWRSSEMSVASVDASGLVTGVGEGMATITASAGSASGSAVVTVTQPVASVHVSPPAGTIGLGGTLQLTAEGFGQDGVAVEGAEFVWESSDTAIASVDASGLVKGIGEGVTTITARAGHGEGTAEITVMDAARAVLVALYEATDGPNWTNANNWLTDAALGEWHGVDTDARGRVTGLDLGRNGLVGPIPPELGSLASLETLLLLGNELTGPIPPELGNLTSLRRLYLNGNRLTGSIPAELGNLTSLETLALSGNGLTGSIPPELGSLASLETLALSGNSLTGPIPTELGSLTSLETLVIARNPVTGPIPPELGSLANLRVLQFHVTSISGSIPPELGNLANLERLSLSFNRLSGPIPPELGNLTSLKHLDLNSNANGLTGPIPPELGNLASLERLDLGGNRLSGPIPPELGNLASLEWLLLNRNALSGPIPPELGNLASLKTLFLPTNALSGPIPPEFQNLSNLEQLSFVDSGLCGPGTEDFVAWLSRMPAGLDGPLCNETDRAALESLFELAGGARWTNAVGWGDSAVLGSWYGVSADSLGRVTELDLTRNGLAGRLPQVLGDLKGMTALRVEGNALSGPLPRSLSRLSLVELHYADTGLCAPAEASFHNWLNRIPSHQGTGVACASRSERDILVALYEATNGANWTNDENWLTDAPLGDWYGVHTESSGRVDRLILHRNNLTGSIPRELGSLASLKQLWLFDNRLTGPIPVELGSLTSLEELQLSSNSLTGPIPAELGNLTSLEELTLFTNRLTGPIPAELGSLTSLRELSLSFNSLTGPIPAELGDLTRLTSLWLHLNRLSGSIPPELGSLTSLERLTLDRNFLSGPIPAELGSLTSLRRLLLNSNSFTGPIPPELGDLASLQMLRVSGNALSGPIPPELGNLTSLEALLLHFNSLSGPIPAELGSLASLRELRLDYNLLSGEVPEEFGSLSSLRDLHLAHNLGMSGPLPARLTDLRLQVLSTGGTGLCAPSDSAFQRWLETIDRQWIATCPREGALMAYLTQAVQSLEHPVPLVAGERALLRVFVATEQPTTASIPAVRARFFLDGAETHVAEIPATMTTIPTEVIEHDLSRSANAEIPADIVRPGLEMVVEIDPDGELDSSVPVTKRLPETGRMQIDVRDVPPFDLTVVPFLRSPDPDSAVVEAAEGMAADPDGHELLWATHDLLPIRELGVTAHEPVLSSTDDILELLAETRAIWVLEGSRGHYMGVVSSPLGGIDGAADRRGRVSFAKLDASVMAHELGHNLSLQHAPCGLLGGRSDPSYPYRFGATGTWGYDFRAGGRLVDPGAWDLMSYCHPQWISDYHFTNALRYRLSDEGPPQVASIVAQEVEALLLWGGADAEGGPLLNPAFVVDAPPALPSGAGEYRITGRNASGNELFGLDFAMPEVADGDGSSSFAFVLPVEPGWADSLASISLSGPGGSVSLDADTDVPMSILVDPGTGQVRGFLRDVPEADAGAARTSQAGGGSLDTLFSRGIPDAAAWDR